MKTLKRHKSYKTMFQLTFVIILFLVIKQSFGKPLSQDNNDQQIRRKRSGISDQRLAELETLLALKRLRDQQLRTRSPVAYGLFDPAKIGRRRKREKRDHDIDDEDDTSILRHKIKTLLSTHRY